MIKLDTKDEAKPESRGERWIVCAACEAVVCHDTHRISVNGSHTHQRMNPHGFQFDIGCFSKASGMRRSEETSDEFSWFPGYVWSVGACESCGQQLGWWFVSGQEEFCGLILNRLLPVDEPRP